MDAWPMIKADREALGAYLAALSEDDWKKQSLCTEWTVKDAAIHLLVIPTMSKGRVFLAFVSSGFNLDKMSAKLIDRLGQEMSTEQIAAATTSSAGSQNTPPGLKPLGALAEVLLHSGDLAEGVGTPLDLPVDHWVTGLGYLKGVQPVLGAKKRIAGLQLTATDTDWSTGDGPAVQGPAKYLALAMTGRAVTDHLSGDGVATLRSR